MEHIYTIAAIWLGMAILSAIVAYHIRVSIALVEICVGTIAAAVANYYGAIDILAPDQEWLKFLASSGSVMLTFLAGAELDPKVMRTKVKEVTFVGLMGFVAPFLGCAAIAHYLVGWEWQASWLCGIALSTTSMAVVYAVMMETGLNKTEYGKGILGACFINDLGTVIALGLLFSPFTYKTIVFIVATIVIMAILPRGVKALDRTYAQRSPAIRTKCILFLLFCLGALALWSGSEAVLPAYLVGMMLAEFANNDAVAIQRLRTLTVGFLTPFYFLRAGTFVSLPALAMAPFAFIVLLLSKVFSKIFGLYPVIAQFRRDKNERWYYTLLMSTGLTFGTISAMFGLTHNIVTKEQYSFIVAAVIASAVIPTLIAGMAFLPRHLLPKEAKVHEKRVRDRREPAEDIQERASEEG